MRRFPTPPLDRAFYEKLRSLRHTFRLVDKVAIPKEPGTGFVVRRGHTVRLICVEGPQIADVDVFNSNDPREHLWANQTLTREAFT